MDVIEAIKNRRSIRKYKSDAVSDELLKKVLDSARWAPSWANTQCWKFIIVKDEKTKQKLQETLTPTNPARNAVIQAPIIIVACGEKGKAGYRKGESTPLTNKGDWFMFDVALSLANLTLTAHSLGLGTVHIGAFDAKKVEEILKTPENIEVIELIPIGYPDERPSPPLRKELSEIVYAEEYGKPYLF